MTRDLIRQDDINSKVELIKNTVAKNATDTELEFFMHLANKYDLDPFAKEIWFIKYSDKDKPQIYTSRDGYLKIAHASGVFDGMESYTIDNDKGEPVKAVCKVYRKDMSRPFSAEIKVNEYRQKSPTWDKYPSAMAIKVAEVFALKRAFSISGLVTSDEMHIEPKPILGKTVNQEFEDWNKDENQPALAEKISKEQVAELQKLVVKALLTGPEFLEILSFWNYKKPQEITTAHFDEIKDAVSTVTKKEGVAE